MRFLEVTERKKIESFSKSDLEYAYQTALRIKARCEQEGVGIISYYDNDFPKTLRDCTDETGKLNPPIILYYRGNVKVLEKPGVAVIGTREPTMNGIQAGKYFSSEFAKRGYNIVSGLAIGCDAAGHQGALEVGGVTTAFWLMGLIGNLSIPKRTLN